MVQKELFVLIAIVHRKQKAVGLEERELLPDIMNTEYIEANTIYDVKRELFSACMEPLIIKLKGLSQKGLK